MSTTRRVQYVIEGDTRSVEMALNRLNGTISRVGGGMREMTRQGSLLDNQLKAIGTTMRYSFAGGIVFGVKSAIQNLSQFETKLGQIAALMAGSGMNTGQIGRDINQLAEHTISSSARLAVPMSQIQEQIQTFYSSFDTSKTINGKTPVQRAKDFADVVTMLGAASETSNYQQLTEGVIGFANALGRGLPDVRSFSNEIARFVGVSVGFRGDVLATYIGNLGATGRSGGFTSSQTLAVVAAASKVGGSPATIARGSAQLMRTILHPNTPDQQLAYRTLGLPTDATQLARMGGFKVLQQMIRGIQARGGVEANPQLLRAVDDETLANATGPGDLGVRGGAAGIAYNLFGRAESFRTLVAIMAQQGKSENLEYFNQQIKEAGQNQNLLNKMNQARIAQMPLGQAATSVAAAQMTVTRGLNPLLRPVAHTISAVGGLIADNPDIAHEVEWGLAGLGGVALSAVGLRRMRRLFGARGARGAGRGALGASLTAEALPNLIGGGAADGSRSNPYWVIIHPGSNLVGTGPGGGAPGGNPSKWFGIGATASRAAQIARMAARGGGGLAAAGALLPALPDAISMLMGGDPFSSGLASPLFREYQALKKSGQPVPAWMEHAVKRATHGDPLSWLHLRSPDIDPHQAEHFLGQAYRSRAGLRALDTESTRERQAATRALRYAHAGTDIDRILGVEGMLEGNFRITLVDKQGHEIVVSEQNRIPTKLWPKNHAPKNRGKDGTPRKAHA